jgi:hypothetical protein
VTFISQEKYMSEQVEQAKTAKADEKTPELKLSDKSAQDGIVPATDNIAPATIKPSFTKSKNVRATLTGQDFLSFHEISGRVEFASNIGDRAADEELVKIAIRLLKKEIDRRLQNGEQFIMADSL